MELLRFSGGLFRICQLTDKLTNVTNGILGYWSPLLVKSHVIATLGKKTNATSRKIT